MDEPKHPLTIIMSDLIRELRKRRGDTLEQLADRAGIHRTSLGLIERGERQPSLSVCIHLATALDTTASELILKAELISQGRLSFVDALSGTIARTPRADCIRNEFALAQLTGLSSSMLLEAIQGCYTMLDTIDAELIASGSRPIGGLVELANLSSMVGNMVGGALADASEGLYVRNRPHQYPDLLPRRPPARNLELKMALETNRPKGHLPKPGTYITFRYVLADRLGAFTRGREHRGDTVWIWEVKVGEVRAEDFDISNTSGDSGKTAVIKTTVFNNMPLVYFDSAMSPFAMRNDFYPGLN